MVAERLAREAKKARTRQRITAAARELFGRQGVAPTTVRQIALLAGIGVGTFFNYFPTKDAVIAAFGQDLAADIRALVASPALAGLGTRAQVEAVLLAMSRSVEADPETTRAIVTAILRSPAAISSERRQVFEIEALLAQVLGAGQARGDVPAVADVATAASLLTAGYVLLVLDWAQGDRAGSLCDAVLARVALVWQGIAPGTPHADEPH